MIDGWLMSRLLLALSLLLASVQLNLAVAQDAQFTAQGTTSCLRCHSGERMAAMADTAHGDADNPHSPFAQQGCESCHGPGSLHVSRARGGAGFPALLRFGDKNTRPRQTAACLNCHANAMGAAAGMEWSGSAHDTPRMTCVGCHEMHTTDQPLSDPETQKKNCMRCHEEEIAVHPRFADKGIVFDKLTCSDCHDVHQLISAESD